MLVEVELIGSDLRFVEDKSVGCDLVFAEVADVTVRGAAGRPRGFWTRSISDPGLIPLLISRGVSFMAVQVHTHRPYAALITCSGQCIRTCCPYALNVILQAQSYKQHTHSMRYYVSRDGTVFQTTLSMYIIQLHVSREACKGRRGFV